MYIEVKKHQKKNSVILKSKAIIPSPTRALLFHYKTEHIFLFINKFIHNIHIRERMKK
jgi:hypothetical protein